jgi:peroxiredoxin
MLPLRINFAVAHMTILLLILFTLPACSASTPAPQSLSPTEGPTQQATILASPAENANTKYQEPDWTSIPLVDARTGKTFTLASFVGKTVYVEPMATWCTNCRRQLRNVEDARSQLNSDQVVFIGLSVAENVDNATLAQYVNSNDWNFTFAVAPETFIKGMVDSFGRTSVTPPSTPHFIIRPDGSLTEIRTGSHSPDELVTELKAIMEG